MKKNLTILALTIIVIFSIFVGIGIFNKDSEKIKELKTKQEVILQQSLVDMLNGKCDYEIGPMFTSQIDKSNKSTLKLKTHYIVNISGTNFEDNLLVDWNTPIKEQNIFTEDNKKTFQNMLDHINELKEKDLEETLVSLSIELLKPQLAYPSEASFGGATMKKLDFQYEDGNLLYEVKGTVKAKNALGVSLKHTYFVDFKMTQDLSKYEVVDFRID